MSSADVRSIEEGTNTVPFHQVQIETIDVRVAEHDNLLPEIHAHRNDEHFAYDTHSSNSDVDSSTVSDPFDLNSDSESLFSEEIPYKSSIDEDHLLFDFESDWASQSNSVQDDDRQDLFQKRLTYYIQTGQLNVICQGKV